MGLREEIQADIAEAFNDDLADAVHSFTCDRISRKDWDPKTETYVEVLCTRQISQNPYPIRVLPS